MDTTSLPQDYLNRFGGVARLVGSAGLEKLHAAHVCVIGVGGVGSWAVEGLARSGVGAITMIDLDDVCVTNVNRQLPALDGTVGRPKVAVLAERVRLINPGCRVEVRTEFFTKDSAERLLGGAGFDGVIDAIDGMTQKALLIAECVRRGLRCVTVGGAGGKRDATLVRVGDLGDSHGDGLLRLVRKKLRRDHGFAGGKGNQYGVRCVSSAEHPVYPWANGTCSTEQEPGSALTLDCATGFGTAVWVTAAFGFAAAQEAVGLVVTGAGRGGEMTNDQ
ncbi:tRNA cyclic N6-threonylcarbamoyladenosine(37) synthase TcdA [Nibricoccus aquaticus]|uniref:tRNA cyclic N6-threonylcarbamoyladenosine(37) synthase TcdA n=1 Tax=Nibricoccus aquaticus TaxID=2576891 RepID=A0A290QBD1_9BACT|nr:tRNA threonylcarbamoyladenosine dehydratase [Nibricoccus aquaticus]ATC66005.1 tRNA cyclic N6-threonylcarbamoyladenosine(37) synthase TcdA [Nibricoccus aquaticus]